MQPILICTSLFLDNTLWKNGLNMKTHEPSKYEKFKLYCHIMIKKRLLKKTFKSDLIHIPCCLQICLTQPTHQGTRPCQLNTTTLSYQMPSLHYDLFYENLVIKIMKEILYVFVFLVFFILIYLEWIIILSYIICVVL